MSLSRAEGELTSSRFALIVDDQEAELIASCIGEAIEAVDEWEFPIRLGAEPSQARALLAQMRRALQDG